MVGHPLQEYEECDGEILVDIYIDSDGYNDDCSCYVTTVYVCAKCKNQHFPELPRGPDGVAKLAAERIAQL